MIANHCLCGDCFKSCYYLNSFSLRGSYFESDRLKFDYCFIEIIAHCSIDDIWILGKLGTISYSRITHFHRLIKNVIFESFDNVYGIIHII